jgi:hypothetical protein
VAPLPADRPSPARPASRLRRDQHRRAGLGLAGCLLILGYIRYERNYDTWIPGHERVHQVQTTIRPPGQPVVRDIVRLLAWQFSKPVVLANLLAWPIAWWAMRDWLNTFDARIALTPGAVPARRAARARHRRRHRRRPRDPRRPHQSDSRTEVRIARTRGQKMWRNYLTVGVRALAKNRTYAFINVFGLAIGMAACLMILLFVRYELSYDRWIADSDRIFQFQSWYKSSETGEENKLQMTPWIAGERLGKDFPQVEHRVYGFTTTPVFIKDGQASTIEDWLFVDSNFLKVFPLPMLRGDHER